ncbi:MAG TPA: M48 family metallopeptidase [Thermoanaerobaculia bacterium]|nr:M48 family metallopeptidase [Thermoanaerobaculia bacterium]
MLRKLVPPAALAALLIVAVAAGCATSGVNQGDFNIVSIEEEWQLGRKLEADIARQLPLLNDRSALAYLNGIGQRLVRQTELGGRPWEFHIVRDSKVNAFNIPGGHVYVNTGLIQSAANASELAGVLGHEIAHGVSRHATEQLSKSYGLSMVASLVLGQNPAAYEQILAQIVGAGTLASFSRDAEREADRLGVRYMHGAGYNPEGMTRMFEKLLAQRRSRPGAVQQFFSTHPLTENRLKELRADIAQLPDSSRLANNDSGFAGFKQRAGR